MEYNNKKKELTTTRDKLCEKNSNRPNCSKLYFSPLDGFTLVCEQKERRRADPAVRDFVRASSVMRPQTIRSVF